MPVNTAKHSYPILCGGTFFCLLLNAVGQRIGKRSESRGLSDGKGQRELLIALSKIIAPAFKGEVTNNTLETNVGEYKKCENNGGASFEYVFNKYSIEAFERRCKEEHSTVLRDVTVLAANFVEHNKAVWLVKAVLEVIKKDRNTDGAVFSFGDKTLTKTEIVDIAEVSLPEFLLAIWRYIVLNVLDNTVGRETFEHWHVKQTNAKRSQWKPKEEVMSRLGSEIPQDIRILPYPELDIEIDPKAVNIEEETAKSEEGFEDMNGKAGFSHETEFNDAFEKTDNQGKTFNFGHVDKLTIAEKVIQGPVYIENFN